MNLPFGFIFSSCWATEPDRMAADYNQGVDGKTHDLVSSGRGKGVLLACEVAGGGNPKARE
jgi:hypothetical protein